MKIFSWHKNHIPQLIIVIIIIIIIIIIIFILLEMSGNLPGMNVMDQPGVGGGMDPLNLMPPPPSREAITLPPPSAASPWRQGGGER